MDEPAEENWWDDRTMPNDTGPDWVRDGDGILWQVDPVTGRTTVAVDPASPRREARTSASSGASGRDDS